MKPLRGARDGGAGSRPRNVPETPARKTKGDLNGDGPRTARVGGGRGGASETVPASPLCPLRPVPVPPALHAVEPCAAGRPGPAVSHRALRLGAVVGGVALWVALAAAAPGVVAVAVVAAAMLACGQAALQLSAARPAPPRSLSPGEARAGRGGEIGLVSVHVPICNEPPALVCRTLSALARMDGAFEVVVLDNNTADRALWEPVRDHCLRLGRRFRFVHLARLDGAKAGALTECLRRTSPEATHVLTVDADYAVRPDLLARAADALRRAGRRPVGAVQFPQAYANAGGAEGLALAYRQFFALAMPAAERAGAALLTGTLSLIARPALEAAGGWSAATITEDADLGARLGAAGYAVVYAPDRVGRGVMPTDLCALRAQRRRWACGNAQTLRARRGGRPALWHQLTFWSSPLAVPAAALAAFAVVGTGGAAGHAAAHVAAFTVAGWLGARGLVLLGAARADGQPASVAVRAWLAERGLAWETWTAGWEGALGARLPFVRTRKDLSSGRARGAGPTLAVAAALALSGVLLALRGAPVAGALALVSGGAVGLGLAVLLRELAAAARSAVPVHAEAAAVLADARPALAS